MYPPSNEHHFLDQDFASSSHSSSQPSIFMERRVKIFLGSGGKFNGLEVGVVGTGARSLNGVGGGGGDINLFDDAELGEPG